MSLLGQEGLAASRPSSPRKRGAIALVVCGALAVVLAQVVASLPGRFYASVPGWLAGLIVFGCVVGAARALARGIGSSDALTAAAAWLAPAALLARLGSWWALPAAVVFATQAVAALRGLAGEDPGEPEPEPGRLAWGAKGAAALGYCALALALSDQPPAAAAAGAGAAAVVAWLRLPGRPRWSRARIAAALAATLFTLAPPGRLETRRPAEQGEAGEEAGPAFRPRGNLHAGVVLLAHVSAEPPLAAPPSPRPRDPAAARPAKPASIPFSGEYWFFFWPLRRPGDDALRKHGSPLALAYSAVDGSAVVMQATQPLAKAVGLGCCSAIDVVLRSRESRPETVAVELILVDSSGERRQELSLGAQDLPAAAEAHAALRYPVPGAPPFEAFDRILLRFQLASSRRDRSASLAVVRFDLIP